MALKWIWFGFFIIAFIVALVRVLLPDTHAFYDPTVFSRMVESTFTMAKTSIEIIIYLIGVMVLWLGIMKIGENGGAVRILSRIVGPFFTRLFPELPKDHPASGSMLMNFSANMLGLDNAATPLGLKAMNELQEVNTTKDTASNAQIMFLVLNTSGLTIIPISVLAIRAANGAADPSDIFLPILLATYFSTLAGLLAVSIWQRINLFQPVILAWLVGLTGLIGLLMWWFSGLSEAQVKLYSSFGGNFILFGIIIAFLVLAIARKVNVYESFIEGAKDGFQVAIKIIPYLVAMLVAIGVFRASGAMDMMLEGIRWGVASVGLDTRFVDALPTAMMKPLSGSGARGAMVEYWVSCEGCVDTFAGKLAATFQGSTETTFYTLAVYFGAVSIRKTRYTVVCGLIADLAGIIAAIIIAYIFFT